MDFKWFAMASLCYLLISSAVHPDVGILRIIGRGVFLVALVIFLHWFFSLGMWNKRTCGHESDSYRCVAGERMWMCHECYSEYRHDRIMGGW